MHRRELLRLLSSAAIAPVLSADLFAALRQAQPPSNYTIRSMTAHQNETVVAMTDRIVPVTDTPGAKAARVNEFIDVILTEWATPGERQEFLAGLGDVDALSGKLYAGKFIEISPEQQMALLQSLDGTIDWAGAPLRGSDAVAGERDLQFRGEFFRVFKTITLHGYYTSEIGFSQELKLEIIPGAQHGCVPVPVGKKA
jgi:hypothetical protein